MIVQRDRKQFVIDNEAQGSKSLHKFSTVEILKSIQLTKAGDVLRNSVLK